MRMWKSVCAVALLAFYGSVIAATIRPAGDPPIGNVIWADPFDYYNQWAWDNQDDPSYPRGTLWQGGPIPPLNDPAGPLGWPKKYDLTGPYAGCGVIPQADPNDHEMARNAWIRYPCGLITAPDGNTAFLGSLKAQVDTCSGGWVETYAQYAEVDHTWGTGNYYTSMAQFSHDFTSRIQAVADYYQLGPRNCVNGTDADPLVLVAYLRAHRGGSYDNFYIELALNDDKAPTDYVWRGNRTEDVPEGEYCPQGPYPIVCQQARMVEEDGCEDGGDLVWLNGACPALSPDTVNAFALGFLAIQDRDPCKLACATQHVPTNNHLSVFDGNAWRRIRSGRYDGLASPTPDGYDDVSGKTGTEGFVYSGTFPPENFMTLGATGGSNDCSLSASTNITVILYVKIITSHVMIYMWDSGHPQDNWHAAIPRDNWPGPFNTIRLGVGPGCELDPATGTCKEGGTPYQCLTYGGYGTEGYGRIRADSLSIFTTGNIENNLDYWSTEGACCLPDGSCQVLDAVVCGTAGGEWRGENTTCDGSICLGACCGPKATCTDTLVNACTGDFQGAGTSCATPGVCPCPTPFADWDLDQDVDMQDFSALQRCLTIGQAPPEIQQGCGCFDENDDGAIDGTDVETFAFCATGDGVPWVSTPNCP